MHDGGEGGSGPEGVRCVFREGTTGSGRADKSNVFVQEQELAATLGVAVLDDKVIVSQPPDLLVFTDVNRDGMGEGTDLSGMQELLALDAVDVIASGGIGALKDIQDLVDLQHPRLDGIIVGRALYENAFTLPDALKIVAAAA